MVLVVELGTNDRLGRFVEFVDRNHDRNRARGHGEIDVSRRLLAHIAQIAQHVVGRDTRPFESLHETVAPVEEIFDLFTREFATSGDIGENALAIRAGLVHHVATLLLGHQNLGFGIGRGVLADALTFEFGFLPNASGLIGRVAHEPLGGLLGPTPELGRRLTGGLDDPGGLLAQDLGQLVFVEFTRDDPDLGRAGQEFALEEALPFLQTGQLGGDHPQEVTDLIGVEAAAGRRESRPGHCSGGRRIGTRKGDGHRSEGMKPQVKRGGNRAPSTRVHPL